ncbi:potassium transporter TrkG, partial [Streptococcus sobrinus]|uniref:potassium transporter TrkG n=1 Tax=Streptococcus sobrinus TaxID=1310 RepID=UPI000496438D
RQVMRSLIVSKITKNQILKTLYPNRVMSLHVNHRPLDKATQHGILKYLAVYAMIFLGLILVISLDNNNFMIVVSAVASTFNNIGPLLGTADTFAIFSPWAKFLMSLAMIAGRLEIYPVLLLFIPKTWSKY